MKNRIGDARTYKVLALSLALSLAVAVMISCGGSTTSSTNPTTGTVKTFLSDPPTCSLDFNHVWVTITKVEANISATSDSGWQTLVDLTQKPQQVDLLALNPSATAGFCGTLFLLGSHPLPPGKYQQIRLTLLANNASSGPSSNACGAAGFNCVVPRNPDGSDGTPAELQLSSQAQTGIKITTSQMANGGLTVTAGQSTDFDIDFQTCASILQQGNGQYRFKPVLHGSEVSTTTNSISGKVVEGTGSANPGMGVPNAIVLLEQADSSTTPPTDRVVFKGLTSSDGTFIFCPLAPTSNGNKFDVVVAGATTQTVAAVTTTTTYNPSVVFGVPIGGATASIPLFPETASAGGLVSPGGAKISGQITTQGSGSTPVAGDVQLSAFQTVSNGSGNVNLTIPVLDKSSTPTGNVTDSQPPIYTTVTNTSSSSPAGCATTSLDCIGYSVLVPASPVAVGSYDSTNGNNVAAPSSTSQAMYIIEGLANGSNGLLNCTSPTNGDATSSSVTVAPGQSVDQTTAPSLVLALSGCTAQ